MTLRTSYHYDIPHAELNNEGQGQGDNAHHFR